MNKLIVSKEYIKNFSIATVKDYEGCPEALKMLHQRYGDEVATLSKRKKDFLVLATDDNKPHWVVNFLLNLMQEKYKLNFFESYLDDSIYLCGDKNIAQVIHKAFSAYKKNSSLDKHLATLNKTLEDLNKFNPISESEYQLKLNYVQKFLCESVLVLLADNKRVLTRSLNSALSKIAEAQSVLDLENSRDNIKMKSIALSLIDYTELFED